MKKGLSVWPPLSGVACGVISALFFSSGVQADDDIQFDSNFLRISHPEKVDLSAYMKNGLPAGRYRADIYLNNKLVMIDDIRISGKETDSQRILLSPATIAGLQLKQNRLCVNNDGQWCDLQAVLPESHLEFNGGRQRLDVSIPQAMLQHAARGQVSPALWDAGIPALLLGYNVNGYRSENSGGEYNNLYAALNGGLNIGSWYFRHNGTLSWQQQNGTQQKKYTVLNSYVQHPLAGIEGNLTLGESNTSGQLFDSVAFTGASVASDDRMLPASRRGYAPEIRGVAQTNAKVMVHQNGKLIYETSVSPGAFVINDLYPSGYGGDLNVTVREADGSQHFFDVPYASVAQLLRPGTHRYSATAGRLRGDYLSERPAFGEVTYQRGLTNRLTGSGGIQATSFYQAMQAGFAVGTPVGAVSFDTTWSQTRLREQTLRGESIRLSYSKFIPASQTQFSLATWRYSTGNYLSLMDAALLHQQRPGEGTDGRTGKTRNRMTLTLNQGLPDKWGQMYVTGILQDYWGRKGHDQQYQAGYTLTTGRVNWNLGVNRSRTAGGDFQNIWTLSFNMPLGGISSPLLTGQMLRDGQGHFSEQVALSGSAGERQQFSWNAGASHQHQSGDSGQIGGTWTGPVSTLTANYAQGQAWKSGSLGMSGTAVAHSGGVTFSPWTGNTFALVEAKGAEGAEIPGYAGTRVNRAGYALVPNLMPYQKNSVSIDPTSVEDDLDLDSTSQQVIPYAGAVVKVKYRAAEGVPVLVTVRRSNGEGVPFSARAIDASQQTVGYVGQGGRLYARLTQQSGVLELRWADDAASRCKMKYSLPSTAGKKLLTFNAICN
ncbi:fimbria/pilus outer membrane usher protein [Enterobacter cloacae]|uniref:fimbria/pilus outer membrane usher protein n=1 Tax=Enterobacter cloacae TaxID=550 RepID=UPI00300E9FE3